MNKRHIFTWILVACAATNTVSQNPVPDSLMKKALEHNKTLKVARESFQVALLEAGTGNAPPNPEVEFGYLFGNPADMGNRMDFSVSQQVDFPTTYIHRSRLRKIKTSRAELAYLATRQEVLLQAKQLWIEQIFLNRQEQLLSARLDQAERINEHQRQMVDAGESAQLAYNQSSIHLTTLQSEYAHVQSEIHRNQLAIREIAGGVVVEINASEFPLPAMIVADSLLADYSQSPELQLHIHMQELKAGQKSVIAAENLPKLSAGYYSETVLDQKFKGFQVGVTIPLWENSNRIKKAKSEVSFAEAETQRFTLLQQTELLQKLEQLESLKSRSEQLEETLAAGNSMELLTLAMESGEISLSEYYYASDFYFRSQQQLLEQ
ncbi:MAG: TolC family protein, partial [Bacteroidota bacterium]